MINKIFRKIIYTWKEVRSFLVFWLTRPYWMLRATYPVWYRIVNRESGKMFRENPPTLNDVQKRIVGDLKTNGMAMSNLDELFPGQDLLPKLQAEVQRLMPNGKIRKGKPFLKALIEELPVLDLNNPFTKIALDQKVVDIMNSYIGVYSKFNFLNLNVTLPVQEGSNATHSQRWHRDPEDKIMCKIFVYLTDVDEGAGPLTYVKGSQYGGPLRMAFPQMPPKGCYPDAAKVAKRVPADKIVPLMGKAGTVLFGDTSGLHRGGYATKKERIMFTAGFNSNASAWPIQYLYPENFDSATANFSPAVKYALKNKPVEKLVSSHMM